MTLSQSPNPERAFLHDISSPLTTLQLNLENVLGALEGVKTEESSDCQRMLKTCLNQTRRVTEMIRARREILIKESAEAK